MFKADELGFTLISPDSRRREAVACLGTVITPVPSNCYIHAPKRRQTAGGGEIAGISHAEPKKGTEAVGFDE